MEKYEYKVVKVHFDLTALNEHLKDGWEPIDSIANHVSGGSPDKEVQGYVFYTLRKLK